MLNAVVSTLSYLVTLISSFCLICAASSAGAALEICGWGGPRLGGLADGSPPVVSRGEAPVGCLGG